MEGRGAEGDGGFGLQGIQHLRAARHAAGVPVFELPPGDEHPGEGGVWLFVGRNQVGGDQLDPPRGRGEMVIKNHRMTRVVSAQARVGDARLLQQT